MTTDSMTWHDWFRSNRTRLKNNGLHMDGGEPGRMDEVEFENASVKILLCRLSTYDDVVHSITHKMLYWAARQVPGVYADLAFFPPARDAMLLKNGGVPFWLASGCKLSPRAFDVVAISISVQQEALNLPAALAHSGLKLSFGERMSDPRHPLVMLGGNAAASSPFIHGNVSPERNDGGLVDVVCAGDGISWLQEFLRLAAEWKQNAESKLNLLEKLAKQVEGTYVPAFYRHYTEHGKLHIEPARKGVPFSVKHRADPSTAWTAGYDGSFIPFCKDDIEETLPLTFGCAYRCKFCQTGWIRGAHDQIARDELVESALRVKTAMAASDLNLLSSDACSVNGIEDTITCLLDIFAHVSVKSLSVAGLSKRADVMGLLGLMEKHEFTFGVEGISARLRAYLGKTADAAKLLELARGLASSGLRQLKLFFIATGLENSDDCAEFESLIKQIHGAAPNCRLITSFTPLFNAPFTPLQFDELRRIDESIFDHAAHAVKMVGGQFRWSAAPDEIRLMNLFCRAGRSATPVLASISLNAGFGYYYDAVPPRAVAEGKRMLMRVAGDGARLDRGVNVGETLPWDDLETGHEKKILWSAFERSNATLPAASRREIRSVASSSFKNIPPHKAVQSSHAIAFWVWLARDDAYRHDTTLARGLFRDLFRDWQDGVKPYLGRPALFRLKGSSGLALLTGQFKVGVEPQRIERELKESGTMRGRGIIEGPIDSSVLNTARFVYLVEIPPDGRFVRQVGKRPALFLDGLMKKGKIPFQFIRNGDEGWYLVGESHRRRSGLLMMKEREDCSLTILCDNGIAEWSGGVLSDILPAGVVSGIYELTAAKCFACGATISQTVKILPGVALPDCVRCFLRDARKNRK